MTDELFMRQWNSGHTLFSANFDRGIAKLRRRGQRRKAIGNSYAFLAKYDEQPAPESSLSPAAQASLRGLAASVVTFGLWIAVIAIATPMPLFA